MTARVGLSDFCAKADESVIQETEKAMKKAFRRRGEMRFDFILFFVFVLVDIDDGKGGGSQNKNKTAI